MHVHLSLNSCMNLIKCMFHFSLGKYHYQLLLLGKAFPNDGCYESRWEMWKCRMKWRREILFSFGRFIAADCCFFSAHDQNIHCIVMTAMAPSLIISSHSIRVTSIPFYSRFVHCWLTIEGTKEALQFLHFFLFPFFSFIMPHDFCRRDVERFLWCWELEFSLAVKGRYLKLW